MWRDDAYLLDMFIAARKAKEFSTGLTWEEFDRSSLHQHAIMKVIENVGEAARKISDETKAAHPEIPWSDIIGMRNRLIHDYFRIDLEKLWDTVQQDIPKLIPLLEPLIKPESP